jgi:hypothetical protein
MQQSGEKIKMEKSIYARDHGKELSAAMTIKQKKGLPFNLAKLTSSVIPQPPPPAPVGNIGSHH